jgi:hypothetical protein
MGTGVAFIDFDDLDARIGLAQALGGAGMLPKLWTYWHKFQDSAGYFQKALELSPERSRLPPEQGVHDTPHYYSENA